MDSPFFANRVARQELDDGGDLGRLGLPIAHAAVPRPLGVRVDTHRAQLGADAVGRREVLAWFGFGFGLGLG